MRLFALTFGGRESASTQYRLFQYADLMAQRGIAFDWAEARGFNDFACLAEYDAVVLQKTIISARRLGQIRRYARRLIYDADDRIWMSPQKKHHWLTRMRIHFRMRSIARQVDVCTAANQVIADDLLAFGASVQVIPMALDLAAWHDCSSKDDAVVIGWSGAPKNTVFLQDIAPALRELKQAYPQIEYCIHSGLAPQIEGVEYTHIPFQPGTESASICRFDIGLLPLPDDPFVAGKSPIKSLQYMATGAAVVAAPIGAVTEIVRDGQTGIYVYGQKDWLAALRRLLDDPDLRQRLTSNGSAFLREKHDMNVVLERMISLYMPSGSAD